MATIRDVARASGCSLGTVSKVLNGRAERVAPNLRLRVMTAVRDLGYSPPPQSRSEAPSYSLGVVLNEIPQATLESHGYYAPVLDGILRMASELGWSVTFFTESMLHPPIKSLRAKVDGKLDGLIFVAPSPDSPLVSCLMERGLPFVVVNGCTQMEGAASYDVDDDAGARLAVRTLAEAGHRRIAYVKAPQDIESSRLRESAYRSEMVRLGLADWICVLPGSSEPKGIQDLAREIASLSPVVRLTALFCWNDDLALRLLHALPTEGLQVPKDISLIGFDGTWEKPEGGRRLATVHQPLGLIAATAASELASSILEGKQPRKTLFAPWIEKGLSVAGPSL